MTDAEHHGPSDRALILAVERDPGVRALERFFREDAECAVEVVADGHRALERARMFHPRILISEILVPGLDGLSLCRALKDNPDTSSTLVVIFSMLAAEERAAEAGADAYLRKPLDDSQLVHTVAELLARDAAAGRRTCRA